MFSANVSVVLIVAVSPAPGLVPPQLSASSHDVPSPAPDHVRVAAAALIATTAAKPNNIALFFMSMPFLIVR